jgi:hypothetical protein
MRRLRLLAAVALALSSAPSIAGAQKLYARCELFAIGGLQQVPRREDACTFQSREIAVLAARLRAIGVEAARLRQPRCVPIADIRGAVRVPTGIKVEVRNTDDYQRLVTAFGAPGSGPATCECATTVCPR